MGRDKAFLEIQGMPLWRRQLGILQSLQPKEIFIAGPPRTEWIEASDAVLPDAKEGTGPLAALVASLRRCTTPHLLALAIDLPNMTAPYLRQLLDSRADEMGVVPIRAGRWEPLAAIYPAAALALAERMLAAGDYALQSFVRKLAAQDLITEKPVELADDPLFLNVNTPADLLNYVA